MILQNSIKNKVIDIKDILINYDYNSSSGIGMMSGTQGIILFLLNYSRLFRDEESLEKALGLLEELFSNLSTNSLSFSNGLGSLPWLVNYINENDFAEIESETLFEELDGTVFEWMVSCCDKGNFDFLHGGIGAGLYFLNRKEGVLTDKAIDFLVKSLLNQAIANNQGLAWHDFDLITNKKKNNVFNFGLSHGIPSILVFLAIIYKTYSSKEYLKDSIYKGISFLMSNQKEPIKRKSYFQYNSELSEDVTSRLAWCYGDIGVSYALWFCGKTIGNARIIKKANEILIYNTTRKDCVSNSVVDAGFCHGSSGLAHIYSKLNELSEEPFFLEASEYWFLETLKFSHFKDGLAGYKSYNPSTKQYNNDLTLLGGISGIGLSMISHLEFNKTNWSEILLLYDIEK